MASHTLGLSLGSVTVESYLNQPLRLRIEILQLEDTRLDDVTVQMAPTDDFVRLGIERVEILSSVRFRTEESADGAHVLLTSNAAITEPYLRFVLEVRVSCVLCLVHLVRALHHVPNGQKAYLCDVRVWKSM